MNSPRLRQLLALLILVAVIGLLLGLVLLPLAERWRSHSDSIASLENQLSVYQRVAANLPEQQARLQQLREHDPAEPLYLPESRPALAAAELQQRIGQLIAESGGQGISTQILKVHMRGETEQLVRILYGLAYSRPLLLVDNLLVLSNPRLDMQRIYRAAERQVLPALDVTFEVLAFMPRRSAP